MTLHRQITPDRPLIVCALETEAEHLHAGELPVLVTGVGKVNAAIAVTAVLSQWRPSLVVNMGTAGALRDGIVGTHVVSSVMQHDLNDASIAELTGMHFGLPIALEHGQSFDAGGLVLATGDRFIARPEVRQRLAEHAHLVDMEGYAVAKAATLAGVPVVCVKDVSDSASEDAGKSWSQTLAECAERLGAWADAHLHR